jgi:hypothetical protein
MLPLVPLWLPVPDVELEPDVPLVLPEPDVPLVLPEPYSLDAEPLGLSLTFVRMNPWPLGSCCRQPVSFTLLPERRECCPDCDVLEPLCDPLIEPL